MNFAILQPGTEIAYVVPDASAVIAVQHTNLVTTGDLLARLAQEGARSLPMLRSTCVVLGMYLNEPADQIPLDKMDLARRGFRAFLLSRKYRENSIRTYIYQMGSMLRRAKALGWDPHASISESWRQLLSLASKGKLFDVVGYFARTTATPADVTVEAVDKWVVSRVREGVLFTNAAAKRNDFWRLLVKTAWVSKPPYTVRKQEKYGIPLGELPPGLRSDIEGVLKWKQADYAPGRPTKGRIRAVTANTLRLSLTQLSGVAINVLGMEPTSLKDLLTKDILEAYVAWAINERGMAGNTVHVKLAGISAVVHHRKFEGLDFSWFKKLMDAIPLEHRSELKKRKAKKTLPYALLESLPAKIATERSAAERSDKAHPLHPARLMIEQLIVMWFLVLPWRQQNLRACRIGGPSPNLFKSRIDATNVIDRPEWVLEEEAKDPDAMFWQVQFSPAETKTKIAVHIVLPRRLVATLELYLEKYRPLLVRDPRVDTLFLNRAGHPMRSDLIDKIIGDKSLKHLGRQTTPHLFRDAVAYQWLKEHPKDYLTLSKALWHKNVQTTIDIYGAQFDEQSGVAAMENWLDEREARPQ
jgi:integrase